MHLAILYMNVFLLVIFLRVVYFFCADAITASTSTDSPSRVFPFSSETEVVETPPPRRFVYEGVEYVVDTVSPKSFHPQFMGKTYCRRFNIHGHACLEDGVMPDYNTMDWCEASGQRHCESEELTKLSKQTPFEQLASRHEQKYLEQKERDRKNEEYIEECRKYYGTEDKPRSVHEDLVFEFMRCLCPSFNPHQTKKETDY